MIPINRRTIVTGVLMTVLVMLIPESVDACPNCKDGLHGNHMTWAFSVSILLMMAMPFVIMAYWIRLFMSGQKQLENSGPSELS